MRFRIERIVATACAHCNNPKTTTYHGQGGEGPLCRECAEREILAWAGEMDEGEHQIMVQRIVTAIKTYPDAYRTARAALVIAGAVDYDDFI